ncbi:hypothetical protein ThvES_00003520 [Thiovulum sp. ES]|nr:hypothetical protein ThvES_00003520 [Thiovulum sp. ES]
MPEKSEYFLDSFRRDLKNSSQILIVSNRIEDDRFFYSFRKFLNRGGEIFLISPNLDGDIEKLRLYKNIYIYKTEPHRGENFSFSGILLDSKILYIFSTPIVKSDIFENGYGIVVKTENKNDISEFQKNYIRFLDRGKKRF